MSIQYTRVNTETLIIQRCQSLHCIENMRCVRPDTTANIVSQECYTENIASAFDNAGTVQCREGYFVKGIWSNTNTNGGCGLYCWEYLNCCQYDPSVLFYSAQVYDQNWWSCFDYNNLWCEADNDRYITGFYRNGGAHSLYLLESAKTREIYELRRMYHKKKRIQSVLIGFIVFLLLLKSATSKFFSKCVTFHFKMLKNICIEQIREIPYIALTGPNKLVGTRQTLQAVA